MNTLKLSILTPEVYHLNPAKSDTNLYHNVIKWAPSALATYASYAFKVRVYINKVNNFIDLSISRLFL